MKLKYINQLTNDELGELCTVYFPPIIEED